MGTLIIIPARYASTRYPGKPLVPLRGGDGQARPLIQRTWDAARAVQDVDRIVVATEDARIRDAVEGFGGEVVMTSDSCRNGTERCAEALAGIGGGYDVVVNFQGDAPLTPPWFVEDLIKAMAAAPEFEMATPVLACDGRAHRSFLEDRAAGRIGGTTAVFAADRTALYFSKEVVPYTGHTYADDAVTPVFHHVGVYAYRPDGLMRYPEWTPGPLEQLEGLEQLRFLENGRKVLCVEVDARDCPFWELNNPEDVSRIEQMMRGMGSG